MKSKNVYGILCIAGAVIWAMTLVFRETDLLNNLFTRTLLNHAPNLSVVWILNFMCSAMYVDFIKKALNLNMIIYINYLFLVGLVVVEYLHIFLKGTRFCIWDILASLLASTVIVGIALFFRKKNNLSFLVGKGRE